MLPTEERKKRTFPKRLAGYESRLAARRKAKEPMPGQADPLLAIAEAFDAIPEEEKPTDERRRIFVKGLLVVVAGVFASSLFPKKAEALVMGSTPSTGVVGMRDASNARVNPARLEGNSVRKKTVLLPASGIVHTPAAGKKVRLYTSKFSLDATMTQVSFRFTPTGTDFEKYLAPRTGGLYGTNNHPNYVEGGVDEPLYCAITGTGNVQVNIDYLEA